MRTMYWGLYNWYTKKWILSDNQLRKRFDRADRAANFLTQTGWERGYSPRPFYVVRKTKKTTQIVEAARVLRDALGAAPYSWHKKETKVFKAWKRLSDLFFHADH